MKVRVAGGLVLAALVLVLSAPVGAASGPQLTTPTKTTKEDLEPARTYADPYVLVDPDNPLVVLAATVEMRSRACRVFRSSDGGGSWKLLESAPSLPSFPYCHHTRGATTMTPMAWGRDGTLYLGRTGWDTQDIGAPGTFPGTWGNMSVLLGRSRDLGNTWETSIVRNARGKQGPETEVNIPVSSVAVDTTRGRDDIVYVTWSSSRYLVRPPVPDTPMVAVSSDGGRTFGEPVVAIGGTSNGYSAECRAAAASRPWRSPRTGRSTCSSWARWTTSTCCCYRRHRSGPHVHDHAGRCAHSVDGRLLHGLGVPLEPRGRRAGNAARPLRGPDGGTVGRPRHFLPAIDRRGTHVQRAA